MNEKIYACVNGFMAGLIEDTKERQEISKKITGMVDGEVHPDIIEKIVIGCVVDVIDNEDDKIRQQLTRISQKIRQMIVRENHKDD